ncbi:uncharacterized protein LOC129743491 [Uranotaenia lowii]|uniref:uncharacterized protein LOC129743491 n=1 Tax=Uranotaenia lowii TaxID=190385 RepID=UPI002479347C|nr:uncharacterized protein LOC129743491 [Uranotaenia lowii]
MLKSTCLVLCCLILITLADGASDPDEKSPKHRIVLNDSYRFLVLGSDHVARTVGMFLAQKNLDHQVLVLQSARCDLSMGGGEKSSASIFAERVADTFVECAQRTGFKVNEAFDPIRGQIGIVRHNRTVLGSEQQTLLAMDPNLKLLTGVNIVRLLFNHASGSILGAEIELNNATQYIYAEEELIIAGRCLNDYDHLARGSIVARDTYLKLLQSTPLDVSWGSPLVAPIFYIHTIQTLDDNSNPTVLEPELLLSVSRHHTPGHIDDEPNTKINLIMGNANLENHIWLGFVPSIISDDIAYQPDHEDTVQMLSYLLKLIATNITDCEAFRQLEMTPLDHHILECKSYVGSSQYWTCYADVRLKRFEKIKHPVSRQMARIVDSDYRINGIRSLRLLPFGLSTPFLWTQLGKLFSAGSVPFERLSPARFTTTTQASAGQFGTSPGTLEATTEIEGQKINAFDRLIAVLKELKAAKGSNVV